MEYKFSVVTSWSITILWVLLSLGLSILTIYSFLQADWIIKRNLIVTNYYQLKNASRYTETEGHRLVYSNSSVVTSKLVTTTVMPVSTQDFDHVELKGETEMNDIEAEMLADDDYFLFNEENYTVIVTPPTPAKRLVSTIPTTTSFPVQLTEDTAHFHDDIEHELVKTKKVLVTTRFGPLGICISKPRLKRRERVKYDCQLYGEGHNHSVSSVWPMVTLIGGSGCVTLCVSAVLSTLAVALPSSYLRFQVALAIGQAQLVAVGLLFASLLLFPLGFNSEFARYHCNSSSGIYNFGDCEIGWAYALVLVCTALALYCPILVKFTSDVDYEVLPKYI